MTRFTGAKAILNVKLYFAKATNVSLTTDLFFSPDNTLLYYPTSSATYASSQLTYDPSLNQYYLSTTLTAGASGTQYNISSGSLIYYSNFNSQFLHAEISYLSSSAINVETNTQFIARAQSSISTRNLINTPSIKSNLLVAFPIITQVYSVGMGDVLMNRDKVLVLPPAIGSPVWLHIGGCVDIYCNVPVVSSLLQFTTDSTGSLTLTGPIYKTSISSIPGGPLTDTINTLNSYTTTNANSVYLTISTLTGQTSGNNTVATVTSLASHGLNVGERFFIVGATQVPYNGTFSVISILSQTSFTYLISNTQYAPPVSPATGSLQLGIVNRTNDVGFSTRQTSILNFAQATKLINNLTSITTGPVSLVYTTVVTITSLGHRYSNGDQITMAGLSFGNGTFIINSVTTDIFKYTFTGSVNPGTIIFAGAIIQSIYGNQNVSLNTNYFQGIDGVQTYLTDSNNRVLASDQLARGFNLTFLDVSVIGYGVSAPSQQTCTTVITGYLATLQPGQPFIMADLLSALYSAGVTTIQTPLTITYTKYWRDLLGFTQGAIVDVLVPNDFTNIFKLNSVVTSVVII